MADLAKKADRRHAPSDRRQEQAGLALLAVLFALTLLMLLALPFAVSMSVGASAAKRDVELVSTEQASASVRELMLADAVLSHEAIDPTPDFDGLDEWPVGVELPETFAAIGDEGRVLLGGEVTDLQRYLPLDSASPLLIANVLGTAARLTEDVEEGGTGLVLDDAGNLPDTGYLWVAHEVVSYESKEGNTLLGVQRGLFQDEGFQDGTESIARGSLVLDYRCVLAATWPHIAPDRNGRRMPFRAVSELAEIEKAGLGSFTQGELDDLQRVFSVDAQAETSATWGRPERVFSQIVAGVTDSLLVKSAAHLGAGSIVRIRNLETGESDYGLVCVTGTPRPGEVQLQLASVFELKLMRKPGRSFPANNTVIEPLVPAPVNINTASEDVLTALFARVRRSAGLRVPADNNRRQQVPLEITRGLARELAQEVVARRRADSGGGPFTGWQDLVERVLRPRIEAEGNNLGRNKWLDLYRCMRTGRDSVLDMGTGPITFKSGPWVVYRAAASRSRSIVAPGVVGRHERTGMAAAVPGFRIERRWDTQKAFESALVLDRRSPMWVTTPINLGHLQPGRAGNDPAPRYFPHLVPIAYPSLGLGAARYAVDDVADSGVEPAVAMVRANRWPNSQNLMGQDSFSFNVNRRGRDVQKEGPYVMNNTGPMATGSTGQSTGGNNRHDQISFPFSVDGGFMGRFGTSFWLEPQTLSNRILFDHNDDNPDRNRLILEAREGNLVFEVIDEAGLDPNPSDSPAGVQRTTSRIELPLTELNLPADTPVHLSVSASSGRTSDMSLMVDGVARGTKRFQTYLTAAIQPFDPTRGNNAVAYGQNPAQTAGSERFLTIQVEDTQGFPPTGVLRIGLELFEYTSIQGNAFVCEFNDSTGGRDRRQTGREFLPSIPVDEATGKPTVDIDDLAAAGVNLAVYPEHPAGALVELYGYTALVSEDTPMMVGGTQLSGSLGSFAIARGFVQNPDPIQLQIASGININIGVGISKDWTGDLRLANPEPTGPNSPNPSTPVQQPPDAPDAIFNAFPERGGYALLIQDETGFDPPPGVIGQNTRIGGVEVIRYQSRNGAVLTGVQRAQQLPGNNDTIPQWMYDGSARDFVTAFPPGWTVNSGQATWNDVPGWILFVVPISIPVQGTTQLWDPAETGLTEWVQLSTQGNDIDTEWVRYDAILNSSDLVRANRAAWSRTYSELTRRFSNRDVSLGQGGQPDDEEISIVQPWGTVTPSQGFIGYTPQIESDWPQIHWARRRLQFRGDPVTGTSSHQQNNATVLPCHRLQLAWGNHGSYTGRTHRHDRVAMVQGTVASGTTRPTVEWHTVNWTYYRFNIDNNNQNSTPAERLGPWPFQLVAFKDEVRNPFIGPPANTAIQDTRRWDRIVKFPSSELPAAFCPNPAIGGGAANEQPVTGIVDEVEVVQHLAFDLMLDDIMTADGQQLIVAPFWHTNTADRFAWGGGADLSAAYPQQGGLIQVDDEVMAYSAVANGTFTIANNGRGLLNTEPRGHDRGARVKFLTHRPAAILAGGVGANAASIPVQAIGPLPSSGTLLMGQELLHYCWAQGNANTLEMPEWYPPNPDGTVDRTTTSSRGLFRARYGTQAQGAAGGDPVILWPIRHWDRHTEFSDDPELAYFQMTTNEAPVFYRDLRWREETRDARVGVICKVRTDSLVPWSADPAENAGLWEFTGGSQDGSAHRIGRQASRLEIRFMTEYRPGCIDLQAFTAHGWKTSARVENVQLQYDGQGRIFMEQVTAR